MVPQLTFIYDRKGQATKFKPAVVELRISAGKVRKYISTGIKLLPKEWKNGSVVCREDWKELNDQLQAIRKKCSGIIARMMDEGMLDINAIPTMLKNELVQQQTFIDYSKEVAERKYQSITTGTKAHYLHTFKFLEQWKGIVYFADVNERNIMRMDDELRRRGLKESSRWNYHKIIKTFIKRAVEDCLLTKNPYSALDIKRGDEGGIKRYLTTAEFHRFESCIIPIESLRRVRDLFVFQTYTMMAYSDLEKFDYEKCIDIDGQKVYKAQRTKTNKEFTIVLIKPAVAILKKYHGKLPIISNVKYNAYLKNAVLYAKIDKQVTTHWARHTGATLLLNEGKVDINTIAKMLGDTLKETERTYAKLHDETIVESMMNYEKRFV